MEREEAELISCRPNVNIYCNYRKELSNWHIHLLVYTLVV